MGIISELDFFLCVFSLGGIFEVESLFALNYFSGYLKQFGKLFLDGFWRPQRWIASLP